MSVKKGLFIVVVTSALLLAVGTGSAFSRFSKLISVSTIAEPKLGGEIVISALDKIFTPSA